ncbi:MULTISPECIES: nitrite reductase large subunit NirB [Bacillus]|uniref:Nitrite reductase n=2 Tax=Bacillus TaxID=1386 RepID=A0A0M3RAM5_9BACI|nr:MULTISPECIES: nitrite reductase large subunit NirB [Bacillus]ALC83436.1 nitrite reductase [Bacillus gobiensis]MBP1082377.1 nitrite reductase (NADH) large subunit [Bacillus capparidis]MED1097364.1 nitrite reductase large subunit NirB [Bacillus capparidis]
MSKRKLVLVGNGMAGVNCIEHILKISDESFDITIFGTEPHPNYNRIQLSYVLGGDSKFEDIIINNWDWYKDNNIQLHTGQTVTKIDTENQCVYTDGGIEQKYDDLILATGSNPFMLPLPGVNLPGVISYRDIKDCEMMVEASKKYKKAAVIGGGLLGLEAARGLLNLSMDVTVIHVFDTLMERQLDPTASKLLQAELEDQGMKFLMSKQTEELYGADRVEGLRFKDGSELDVDLVVMAVGIRPNVALAKEHGVEVNRGIVVNDYLETNVKNVYSVGECAEHRGTVYGLVAPLYEQGAVLAKRISGVETNPYEGSVLSTKLKVSGVDVFSAGEFVDQEDTRAYRYQDDFSGVYKKVLVRDDKVIGAVLFGDTSDGSRLFQMIRNGADAAELKPLLSRESDGEKSGSSNLVADMANDELICGCNGVTKGTIVQAIEEQGLDSVEAIKGCTGASRSCGGCKPLVQELLQCTLGDSFEADEKEPICSCTTLSRDEVVEAIRSINLTTSKEVMNVLEWKNEGGCSKCRPALNYYLGMVWPEDHEDERHSRFVNERLHANIQNDGTYSVVPRIYGGVTNPEQLRKIADAADKYRVPMVKITGGQRIDLLGVKKEDLPNMWADLDMPSGHAYAKALRTVKTCVGENFCRFGTQDSIQMGIDMEKRFERLWTPHKVKMAVSACPRNCAESGIKDIGVVGVDGGWELYVGGNGGVHLRGGDLFVKVKTKEEVLEWSAAFMQYYRETAKYLERTSHWVERVGLEEIKKVLADADMRQELIERMDKALAVTKDPWKEAIEEQEVRKMFDTVNVK